MKNVTTVLPGRQPQVGRAGREGDDAHATPPPSRRVEQLEVGPDRLAHVLVGEPMPALRRLGVVALVADDRPTCGSVVMHGSLSTADCNSGLP